jgi:hypothetical protein
MVDLRAGAARFLCGKLATSIFVHVKERHHLPPKNLGQPILSLQTAN